MIALFDLLPLIAILLVALALVAVLTARAARRPAPDRRARFVEQLAVAHGLPPSAWRAGGPGDAVGLALPDPFAAEAPTGPDGAPLYPPAPPPYLETRTRGSRGETVITAAVPSVPVALTVRPELFGESLDKALGTTIDHELGDRAFDRAFVVTAAPPELARALLGPRARAALLELPRDADSPRLSVRHDGTFAHVTVAFAGEPDPARVMPLLTALRQMGLTLLKLREGITAHSHAPFRAAAGDDAIDPARRHRALAALSAARWRFVALVLALLGVAGGAVAVVYDVAVTW